MTKTKIDSVPDKELEIKQLQTILEKEKTSGKDARRNWSKQIEINTTNHKLITI